MATVIRLKRGGRSHAPYYRLVVVDSRNRSVGGSIIDEIGVYQPCARPEPKVEVDRVKALHWLSQGAQCSDTARNVLSKQGIMGDFHAQKSAPAPVAEG